MEIVGVVLDRPIDRRGHDDMARTFVEEYALWAGRPSVSWTRSDGRLTEVRTTRTRRSARPGSGG